VLRRGHKKNEKNESSGDEPTRQVSMPEQVKQRHVSQNERGDEEREQPTSRRKAVVLGHGFVPFAETALPTGALGASARTK
jgi:hypothetical protein